MARTLKICLVLAFVAGSAMVARAADVLVLKHGGRLVAESIASDPARPGHVIVRLIDGGQVVLDRDQIQEQSRKRPEELEYEKIRARYKDTVEGQWALAEWCRERSLTAQRETHLERILELDANHAPARRALGYNFNEGQWTTPDERLAAMGYIKHKGRWMLPQEKQLESERAELEGIQNGWMQKVKLWRDWLSDPAKAPTARDAILKIRDPYAVRALAKALDEERTPVRDEARRLYVQALANIGDSQARKVLTVWVMTEPTEEIALTCLDHLKRVEDPEVVEFYIGKLRSTKQGEVLAAGRALGHLEARSAVAPLIEALITRHKQVINTGQQPGQTSASFGTRGTPGGGLSVGGGPRTIQIASHNRAVLDALTKITGQSFGFDVVRWRAWYAMQREQMAADARRP